MWTNDCGDCEWQHSLRLHYLLAGIPREYWRLSFDEFFGDGRALATAQEYLANWKHNRLNGTGIRFYSPYIGVGKTTLACLIAKEIAKKKAERPQVQFIRFNDTLGLYRLPYEVSEPIVRRLRNVPVLILDEVSVGWSDDQRAYYAAELESLIRFRTSGNSVTIITTNMTNERLEEVYPRTFSLLAHRQEDVYLNKLDDPTKDARKLLGTNGDKELKPIT